MELYSGTDVIAHYTINVERRQEKKNLIRYSFLSTNRTIFNNARVNGNINEQNQWATSMHKSTQLS